MPSVMVQNASELLSNSNGLYYAPESAIISGQMQNGTPSPSHMERADFPSGQVATQNDSGRSYTILKEVGDGSFGTVWLADWHSPLNLPPGTRPPGPSSRPEYAGKNLVAIKRMKKAFNGGWDECMKLKELRSLRTIPMHPNIIPLYDAFLMPSSRELYFVFECMEGNLYQLTKSRKMRPLAGGLVATLFYQMLSGLHHIHQAGFFHRDMKPENVLITTTGLADYPNENPTRPPAAPPERDVEVIVKLADFGLARETNSKPPYTEYVSTRWYRAPEVLLRDREYSNPVDMWALGTILAEMITLKPLFPGGTEVDQVHRICEVLGDPSDAYVHSNGTPKGGGPWHRGIKLARLVHFEFQPMTPIDFRTLFDLRIVPIQLVDCIFLLLRFDPRLRLTTTQCLQHPYFSQVAARLHPVATGTPAPVQLPPTPNSINGYPPPPTFLPNGQQVPLMSPPHSGIIDPMASRSVPPSHSHGTPAPDYGARNGTAASGGSSHHSIAAPSMLYGNSASEQSDVWRQSMPRSVYSDSWQSSSANPANQLAAGPLPVPAFRQPRISTAVSTFYDGSIFEGIAPTREASIMSFNMYGAQETAASRYAAAYQQSQQRQLPSTIYDEEHQYQAQAGPSSNGAHRSHHLKRTPSERSQHVVEPVAPPPAVPLDPKKAKKEAEKAAKEAERAKREMAQKAARERARAVMQKRNQLEQKMAGQGADPLNTMRSSAKNEALIDKGKGRAAASSLPHIAEHEYAGSTTASRMGGRFKLRRRDDDDDVHSVSSNETRNSNERLKSSGTIDSETGSTRPSWPPYHPHLMARPSSITGLNRVSGIAPPGSSSSSIDDRLAKTFQALTAADLPTRGVDDMSAGQAMHPRYFGAPGQPHLPFLPQMAFPPDGPGKSLPSYQLSPAANGTSHSSTTSQH